MFAPAHHQATRYVIPVRRELAVRTIFNFLGPLTNPAGATRQLIGVSDPGYLETMAGALARLGTEHALLVCERGRARRAQHLGADASWSRSLDGELRQLHVSRPRTWGSQRAPRRSRARRRPAAERRHGAEHLRRRARCGARPRGAQRRRRDLRRRAAPTRCEQGVRAAEQAIDDGAATAALERFVARHAAQLAGVVNALDPIIASTREEVAQAARSRARRRARARARRGAEDELRPFARGARARRACR